MYTAPESTLSRVASSSLCSSMRSASLPGGGSRGGAGRGRGRAEREGHRMNKRKGQIVSKNVTVQLEATTTPAIKHSD